MNIIFRYLISVTFIFFFFGNLYSAQYSYQKFNKLSFWEKRFKELDKVLLSENQIKKLNANIRLLKDSTILITKKFTEKFVLDEIMKSLNYFWRIPKVDKTNKRIYLKNFIAQINIGGIFPTLKKQLYGVSLNTVKLYVLPNSSEYFHLWNKKFNRNIITIIHVNEPFRILNTSLDERWYFVATEYAYGWIQKKDISFLKSYASFRNFNQTFITILKDNLVIGNKVLKIGDRLPYEGKYFYLPTKDRNNFLKYKKKLINALKKEWFSFGPLKLTKRNILKVAFSMLNEKYVWGGSVDGRDCSNFIRDIFLCFNIKLPRNSYQQSLVGKVFDISLIREKEYFIIKKGLPLLTLLYKKGHIMLYLGKYKNKVFVIHNFVSNEKKGTGSARVTDLYFRDKNFPYRLLRMVVLK